MLSLSFSLFSFYFDVTTALYSSEYCFLPLRMLLPAVVLLRYFFFISLIFMLRIAFIILNKIIAFHIFCLLRLDFWNSAGISAFHIFFFRIAIFSRFIFWLASSTTRHTGKHKKLAKAFQMHATEIQPKNYGFCKNAANNNATKKKSISFIN